MVMPEPFHSHTGDRELAARLLFEAGLDSGLAEFVNPELVELLSAEGMLIRLQKHLLRRDFRRSEIPCRECGGTWRLRQRCAHCTECLCIEC